MDTTPEYTLSAPILLPPDPEEKKKRLLPYAESIAKWYRNKFDPYHPERQLITALHASYLLEARSGEELMGIFAYSIMSPENPDHKQFFDNLDLDKLPENLYPGILEQTGRNKVKQALQEIKLRFNFLEIQEQVVDKSLRKNGISSKFKQVAFSHLPPGNQIIVGDIGTGSSIIQRTKKEVGGVTFYGGLILEPDRELPFNLTSAEFKVLSQVIAHAYVLKHYPGTPMDRNAILDSEIWDDPTVVADFSYAQNNPAVPQIQQAMQKMVEYQDQNPGHFYSGIAVTIIESPIKKLTALSQTTNQKAA